MQVWSCRICGKLVAVTHTCKQCKRQVCEVCFEHDANLCNQCHKCPSREFPLLTLPSKLFLLGFMLVLAGTFLLVVSSILHRNAQATTGIVILIGPIPVILGTGSDSIFAILLAVLLAVLGIILFLILQKRR